MRILHLCYFHHYKFKFNERYGASGVEVTHLLETRKACFSILAGNFFFQTRVFCFRTCPSVYFCLLSSVADFFDGLAVFQIAVAPMFEYKFRKLFANFSWCRIFCSRYFMLFCNFYIFYWQKHFFKSFLNFFLIISQMVRSSASSLLPLKLFFEFEEN